MFKPRRYRGEYPERIRAIWIEYTEHRFGISIMYIQTMDYRCYQVTKPGCPRPKLGESINQYQPYIVRIR